MKYLQIARLQVARALVSAFLLAGFACAGIGVASLSYAVAESTQRSVQGLVVNESGTPVQNAIVYLSDTRTKTVESYITQSDGAYRFEQISRDDDYRLWAQINGKRSKTRTLSSFDDRSVFHVILKVDKGK